MPLPFDWTKLPRQPIFQGLLLSVALHLAAILLLQPAPGAGTPRTLVINARMELPPPAPSPTEHQVRTEAPAATQNEPTLPVAPLPILAARTPAPVPPMPSPPAQVIGEATPKTPAPQDASAAPTPARPVPPQGNPASIADSSILPGLPIAIDTTWYLARQVDVHPKPIGSVQPAYPEEARRRGLEGTLKLMLKIDDLGRVQSAEVVEATPPGVFEEAALEAFRHARFQPAMRDGRPVRYQAYIRVEFKLKD